MNEKIQLLVMMTIKQVIVFYTELLSMVLQIKN